MVERTAMGWLVSPAVLISGLETAVDARPHPGLSLATVGLLAVLAAVWQRLGRARIEEPPLAARPLALPPAELEIELAAVREPMRPPDHAVAEHPDYRPRWVRRMGEWADGPAGARPSKPEGPWDAAPAEGVPAGWLPEPDADRPRVAAAD